MNKREFVLSACAAAASSAALAGPTALPAVDSAGANSGLRLKRLADLATDVSSEAWQSYLGHGFSVGAVPLTLRAVELSDDGGAELEQFSLLFSANSAALLQTGTQTLLHGSGQRVALYLDAMPAVDDQQVAYQAHFSLLT